jgi:hypothetical protein
MDAPLSQREFDTWREADNTFKGEMRDFIAAQVHLNLGSENRLTKVEEKQASSERKVIAITTVVSAAVGALMGFFGHKA